MDEKVNQPKPPGTCKVVREVPSGDEQLAAKQAKIRAEKAKKAGK